MMAKTWHLFPGSNTCEGFVGFFENLRRQADRCVILKGGPGVGKSTLMGRVGKHFERLGLDTGYYHCSGDPDSLDAVFCPQAGFLILDGTAPHIIDPALPGVADGILNLGVCLDEAQLAEQKEEISLLSREISACYAQAYRCLKGAQAMREDAASALMEALPEKEQRLLQRELMAMLPSASSGPDTHAFAQAITWQGVLQRVDSIPAETVYCLDAPWGFDADALLRPLWNLGGYMNARRGAYHDPLDAGKLSHVTVGDALFTTAVFLDAAVFTPQLDAGALRRESARLAFDRAAFDLLQNRAIEALSQAKEKHDALERYYVDAMDYARLDEIKRSLLQSLPC